MSEDVQKKVDESWKEQAFKDASSDAPESAQAKEQMPEPSFPLFVSSLAMQGLMFLGHLPNPVSKQNETDLPQAKYILDVLGIIQDKTSGNLAKEEEDLLGNLLYDLRVKYVELTQQSA